jgi:hypothetical protein
MTDVVTQVVQKIEAGLAALETDIVGYVKDTIEPAIKAEFAVLEPQVLGLGETVLGQVWTAAQTYLASGGSATSAVAAVIAQLPADLQALEHLVMAAFGGAVQGIQASAVAAAPPAPAAS